MRVHDVCVCVCVRARPNSQLSNGQAYSFQKGYEEVCAFGLLEPSGPSKLDSWSKNDSFWLGERLWTFKIRLLHILGLFFLSLSGLWSQFSGLRSQVSSLRSQISDNTFAFSIIQITEHLKLSLVFVLFSPSNLL